MPTVSAFLFLFSPCNREGKPVWVEKHHIKHIHVLITNDVLMEMEAGPEEVLHACCAILD